YDLIRANGRHEAFHNVNDILAPPLFSQPFHTAQADIALVSTSLVGQMTQFHRDHDAIGNYRRAKSCAQTNKKHQPSIVTAQRLHRRVVDNLDRPRKGALEIKSNPSSPQIVWLQNDPIIPNDAGITNRHAVVIPIRRAPLDLSHKLARSQVWSGG